MAQETVTILEAGVYNTAEGRVDIAPQLSAAINATKLYRPTDFPDTIEARATDAHTTPSVEITGETSLEAAARLAGESNPPDPLCLNFASARNPGGGFLSGSQAQEESLARSSGIYPTLTRTMEMYEHNRHLSTCLYSDHMIYSPNVPVFRNDQGDLLISPYSISFLTVPAVNAGAVAKNEPQNVPAIRHTMKRRLERLLWVARENGHATLILGAWGCGVFRNDPAMIAELFHEALGPRGTFAGDFRRIVYAVFDQSADQGVLAAFRRMLTP